MYSDFFNSKKYKVIVLDMDGTLYYQRAMQILMCMEMGAFAIRHPFSLWKLKAISVFRMIREREEFLNESWKESAKSVQADSNLLEYQYYLTACQIHREAEEVRQVIEEWMFLRPLKYLRYTCDKKLLECIYGWKKQGKSVVVYSDYPAKAKCIALGIEADAIYSAEAPAIGQQKPSTKGLELISQEFGVTAKEILVIGDRKSKDARAAETFGCEYVILGKWKILRKFQYGK